ncbi:MAG: DUF4129 domain-containing protein [Gemmatimonadales bacterium]|nr:MAG: DUF4129 domain-containing protein [Gemmatimonadales bacterium]
MPEALPQREQRASLLQAIASTGMELSWMYAVFALLSLVLGLPLFPPGLTIVLFIVAVVPNPITRGRGWRRYAVGAVYLAFLLPAALVAAVFLRPWIEPGRPFADLRWILPTRALEEVGAWVTPASLAAGCIAFWWSGFSFSRRPTSAAAVTRRFDTGVASLCAVVIIGWAAGETGAPLRLLIASFFLFAILAVALARGNGTGTRSFPVGFRGAGIAFSFAVTASILGLAAAMLLPVVRLAAQAGYSVVRSAAVSAWPLVLAFLRWLYGLWTRKPDQPLAPPDHPGQAPLVRSMLDMSPLGRILYWAIVGIIGTVLLFLVGSIAWQIALFLRSRTSRDGRIGARAGPGRLLASVLSAFVGFLRRLLALGSLHPKDAVEAFARLARWGRRSGVVRRPAETPLEYSRRLGGSFPDLQTPIGTIVDCFNGQFFGGLALDRGRRRELNRSSISIRRPRHWLARLRSRLRPN